MAYDEKTAERVRELLSTRRDVVEKKMMGGLSFMVKGHMCCSVSGRGGLMVRVGADAQDLMLSGPHVQPIEMAGRTMTGFVRVAPEGYQTEVGLRAWLNRALDFVATLPEGGSSKVSRRRRAKRLRRPYT
jgi:TfoX/Sxy family transcriptional regulator of competence genes